MSGPIPRDWLVPARPVRVITHWTAGGYRPNEVDREHYHFLIDGQGNVHRGDHAVSDNDAAGDGDYAAHTRACNTRSIGIAVCCMREAVQAPLRVGPSPLTKRLWEVLIAAVAQCCRHYGIPVDEQHVLSHWEVGPILGIPQAGKWDITVLPWDRGRAPKEVGRLFREAVRAARAGG